jgi:hypothetical protein
MKATERSSPSERTPSLDLLSFVWPISSNTGRQRRPKGGDPFDPTVHFYDPGNAPRGLVEAGIAAMYGRYINRFASDFLKLLQQQPRLWEEVGVSSEQLPWITMENDVRRRTERLCADYHVEFGSDQSSRAHLALAAAVLSTYRVLVDRCAVGDIVSYDVLCCFLAAQMQGWMQEIFVVPSLLQNPVPSITSLLETGARIRGTGMDRGCMKNRLFLNFFFFFCMFSKRNCTLQDGRLCRVALQALSVQ